LHLVKRKQPNETQTLTLLISKDRLWRGEKVEGMKHFSVFGRLQKGEGKKGFNGPTLKSISHTNGWKGLATPIFD